MSDKGLPFTDLLSEPNAWSTWAPRSEIAPGFSVEGDGGPLGGPALVVSGGGNPLACGCWRFPLRGLEHGRRYRVEAGFQTLGVDAPGKSVRALLTFGNGGENGSGRFYDQLDYRESRGGWHRLALIFEASEAFRDLVLNLFFAWSAGGRVRWGDVCLSDVTDVPEPGRTVKLAVVSGNPEAPRSPAECIDFYAERLDTAASERADLVCLPELINSTGVPLDRAEIAEPIPGPTSERLADKARTYGMYVAASILERQGKGIYNTGLLIDRTGGIVGKYRKTHPTLGESLLGGTVPGDAYPLFYTDFGTVGYLICYDNHYPEVARVLALKGAEVLLFSNMGDGREGGCLWEPYIRTRALDNQVHIAAAVNGGRSCVVSPKGEILAMADRSRGAVVAATCDLTASVCDSTKRPIRRRYDQLRRTDTFGPLARHLWDG